MVARLGRRLLNAVYYVFQFGEAGADEEREILRERYSNLRRPDRFTINAVLLVSSLLLCTGLGNAVATVMSAITQVGDAQIIAQWPQVLVGSAFVSATGVLGIALNKTLDSALKLDRPETLAAVFSAAWKFVAYSIAGTALVAIVLATGLTRGPVEMKSFSKAALVPVVLAISIGFVPVVIDARKELRIGIIKEKQEKKDAEVRADSSSTVANEPIPAKFPALPIAAGATLSSILVFAAFRAIRKRSKDMG